MDDLRLVFTEKELSKEKCTILSADRAGALELEKQKVVEISPGIVKDEEKIARQIFSPIHYDEELDEIVAAAFHDVKDKGLSVNRLNHASEEDVHHAGLAKAEKDRISKPNRKYIGFCQTDVEEVRLISEGDIRIFAVYDSALPEAIHHADICQIMHEQIDANLPKKVANLNRRTILQEKFCLLIKH